NLPHWEDLYKGTEKNIHQQQEQLHFGTLSDDGLYAQSNELFTGKKVLQLKQKYILTPVKSGLMVIDQKRAHERILFEKFMEVLKSDSVASQQQLFPQTIELNPADAELLKSILPD